MFDDADDDGDDNGDVDDDKGEGEGEGDGEGEGEGDGQVISSNATMCHAHSLPPTHNIRNMFALYLHKIGLKTWNTPFAGVLHFQPSLWENFWTNASCWDTMTKNEKAFDKVD